MLALLLHTVANETRQKRAHIVPALRPRLWDSYASGEQADCLFARLRVQLREIKRFRKFTTVSSSNGVRRIASATGTLPGERYHIVALIASVDSFQRVHYLPINLKIPIVISKCRYW